MCKKYPCLGDSSTEILHPAMKAMARQMGIEEDFREPVTSTQHVLPPRGVSETEMKVYQVRGELIMGTLQSSGYHGGYYGMSGRCGCLGTVCSSTLSLWREVLGQSTGTGEHASVQSMCSTEVGT